MRTIPLLAGTLALVTGILTAEVNASKALHRPGHFNSGPSVIRQITLE
jgi:hypothetical protein